MNRYGKKQIRQWLLCISVSSTAYTQIATAQSCLDLTSCWDGGVITVVGSGNYLGPFDDPFYQPYDPNDDWSDFDNSSGSSGSSEPPQCNCYSSSYRQGPLTASQAESINTRNAAFTALLVTASTYLGNAVGGYFSGGTAGHLGGALAGTAGYLAGQSLEQIYGVHCGDIIEVSVTVCSIGTPEPDDLLGPQSTYSSDRNVIHSHSAGCVDDLDEPLPPGHDLQGGQDIIGF
ncbi:MAG: hypothetical protein Tsb002_11670 [Wenzhouxiangellaceae bacterium]